MPPRFAYWTIIAGGLPTAFRATRQDELLPTFKRIQEKHPDAVMKYFARGKLWESEDEAKEAASVRRHESPAYEERGRNWRPGGEHRDPRQKFRDAKKERNLRWRKERFERRSGHRSPEERPHGDPLRDAASRPPAADRKKSGDRPWRPHGDFRRDAAKRPPAADRKKSGDRPWRPHGDPLRDAASRPPTADRKKSGDRPWRPKGPPRDRTRETATPDKRPLEPRDRKSENVRGGVKPGRPRRAFTPASAARDRRRRG